MSDANQFIIHKNKTMFQGKKILEEKIYIPVKINSGKKPDAIKKMWMPVY